MEITYSTERVGHHGEIAVATGFARTVEGFTSWMQRWKPINAANVDALQYWRDSDRCEWEGLELSEVREGERHIDTTIRLVHDGWKRGMDLYSSLSPALYDCSVPVSIKRRSRWTDQGDDLDMQRVYAGSLDNAWRRTMRTQSRGSQRVRIVIDSLSSVVVSAKEMMWRGVAAVYLADALTAAGYNVEMVSAFNGVTFVDAASKTDVRLGVIVKAFESPVDLATLLPTTALPAWFRLLGHAFGPMVCTRKTRVSGYHVRELDATPYSQDDAQVFIATGKITCRDHAFDWVNGCIEDIELARNAETAAAVVA